MRDHCLLTLATLGLLAGCAGHPTASAPASDMMHCGLLSVTATYIDDRLFLDTGEQTLELHRAISASGAKYQLAEDDTTFFWSKGDSALLQLDGRAWPQCHRHGALPHPLQAQGNEPFWHVELVGNSLLYRTPENQQRDAVPFHQQPLSDGGHRVSADIDGLALTLEVQQEICRDTMSGMLYPYRATLTLDDRIEQGCAGEPESLLQGAEWTIIALDGRPLRSGSGATIEFFADKLVAGNASCNRFTGQHQLSGESLSIGPLATTRMACEPAILEQEHRLLKQLEETHYFELTPQGELELISLEGHRIKAILAENLP